MDLALIKNGDPNQFDLKIEKNDLVLNDGIDAIAQHLSIRLKWFLGEWFLDVTEGTPWFQEILVKNPAFAVVQQIFQSRILDTPGVLFLNSFEFNYDNLTRAAAFDFRATTTDGIIDFSQLIPTA